MDIKMKHRIIGIVVLIALAVIFIPFLFGRGEKGPKLASHIPNPPSKPSIELNVPAVSQASVPTTPKSTLPLAVQPLQASTLVNATNPPQPSAQEEATTRIATAAVSASAPATTAATVTAAAPESAAMAPTTSAPAAPNNQLSNQPAPATETTPVSAPPQQPEQPVVKEPHHKKAGFIRAEFAALKFKKAETEHRGVKPAAMGQAWAVQLGSFSQKSNADQLVKRLRDKGFDAYIHVAKMDSGSISRVLVGPELKREKAEALVTKLQQEFQLKGVVVKYKV